MKKRKVVTTNELARLIKHGFDGVDSRFKSVDERFDVVDKRFKSVDERFDKADKRFDTMDTQLKTVNHRLDHLESGIADLKIEMKNGFRGMPSRKEFDDFRRLMDKRDRAFAAKLGLTLAQIDSEG